MSLYDVKMPWLLTQSSLLPLRVRRARGFSIAVMSNIEDIVAFQCRCHGLNNILHTLASKKCLSFVTCYYLTLYNISYAASSSSKGKNGWLRP